MNMERQEIEWQYEAPHGLEKVEKWLGGRDPGAFGLAVFGSPFKEFTDTYYDTEDWRLYRAGYALRIRRGALDSGSEATMKSLTPAEGNLHRRREISELLESDNLVALLRASGSVGIRLRTLLGPRELRPIFEIYTRRQTFDLLLDEQPAEVRVGDSAEAIRIGEVALDDSEIPLGDGSARLTRVEVEVDASATTASSSKLEDFAEAMERNLGLRPTKISKFEAGLFVTGQSPNGEP